MDKQDAPDMDSPPVYDDEALLIESSSNRDPPPPPYSSQEPQQFPPSTGQPAPPGGPPPGLFYIGLPQQTIQHPNQQQQVVLVSRAQSRPATTAQRVQTFAVHILFACIVFLLFNPVFGLVALILAAVASSSAVSNAPRARKLGDASIALSVAGIIIGVTAVVVMVYFFTRCDYYSYEGSCYNFKTYVGTSGSCYNGIKSDSNYCYSKYCFYYEFSGSCYKYRMDIGTYGYCNGAVSDTDYCYYTSCPNYSYGTSCYEYKTFVGSSGSCSYGVKSYEGYCYSTYCPNHAHAGSCYKYKKYVGSSGTCTGIRSDGYCYYNYDNYYAAHCQYCRLLP